MIHAHEPLFEQRLLMVRHGATAPNLAHVRCGGDLDVPLTDIGREQARSAARRLQALDLVPGVIVTSHLQRTRESAALIAEALGVTEVIVEPAFLERRLGEWNLMPIDETEPWLREKRVPPGGEADDVFIARIGGALQGIVPLLPRRPLLVASKGVGRALGVLLRQERPNAIGNGEVVQFDMAAMTRPQLAGCQA